MDLNLSHRVVVTIRNPLDRVLSEFKHAVRNSNKGIWDYCVLKAAFRLPPIKSGNNKLTLANLKAFMDNDVTSDGMRNRQTRMLGLYKPPFNEQNASQMLMYALKILLDESTEVLVTEKIPQSSAVVAHSFKLDTRKHDFKLKQPSLDNLEKKKMSLNLNLINQKLLN